MSLLSIVVPARNEEKAIVKVLTTLRAQFPHAELILVDNGSTDKTVALAEDVECTIISEPQPGKGRAMLAGARAAGGEWLLFHDADTEYDVTDAAAVVNTAILTGACAIGVRMVAFSHLPFSSWAANKVIQWLLARRFDITVPDVLTGTRCLRRSTYLGLAPSVPGFGIETMLTRECLKRGIGISEVPVRYVPRSQKQGKKIRARDMWSLVRIALQ